jgi:hypothetical protein
MREISCCQDYIGHFALAYVSALTLVDFHAVGFLNRSILSQSHCLLLRNHTVELPVPKHLLSYCNFPGQVPSRSDMKKYNVT